MQEFGLISSPENIRLKGYSAIFLSAQNVFIPETLSGCWRSVTTALLFNFAEAMTIKWQGQFFVDIPKLYFQLPCRFLHVEIQPRCLHASLGPLMHAHLKSTHPRGFCSMSNSSAIHLPSLFSFSHFRPNAFPQAPWWLNVVMTTVTMET